MPAWALRADRNRSSSDITYQREEERQPVPVTAYEQEIDALDCHSHAVKDIDNRERS